MYIYKICMNIYVRIEYNIYTYIHTYRYSIHACTHQWNSHKWDLPAPARHAILTDRREDPWDMCWTSAEACVCVCMYVCVYVCIQFMWEKSWSLRHSCEKRADHCAGHLQRHCVCVCMYYIPWQTQLYVTSRGMLPHSLVLLFVCVYVCMVLQNSPCMTSRCMLPYSLVLLCVCVYVYMNACQLTMRDLERDAAPHLDVPLKWKLRALLPAIHNFSLHDMVCMCMHVYVCMCANQALTEESKIICYVNTYRLRNIRSTFSVRERNMI